MAVTAVTQITLKVLSRVLLSKNNITIHMHVVRHDSSGDIRREALLKKTPIPAGASLASPFRTYQHELALTLEPGATGLLMGSCSHDRRGCLIGFLLILAVTAVTDAAKDRHREVFMRMQPLEIFHMLCLALERSGCPETVLGWRC